MTDVRAAEVEEAIKTCVREFYGKARQDPLLGPIFNETVVDWEVHLRVIANFWSKVLLQTDRYNGSPFVLHMNLPIEPEHFERWLALFEETVKATLPGGICYESARQGAAYGRKFQGGHLSVRR